MSKRIVFLFACMMLAVGLYAKPKAKAENSKPLVVTTIGMIADAAKNIGGDDVKVESLMGAGVDPHLYKATAGDVKKLNDADLILYS